MSVNSTLVQAGIFLAASTTLTLCSGFIMFAMIGEINRKLPEQERIGYFFGHLAKYLRIFREYRRLYPKGRLLLFHHVSFAAAMALLLAAGWRLGLFG